MTLYCTLAEAKNEMSATSATTDDSTLLRRIQQVSRRIDREFSSNRPLFAPYRETRPFELNSMSIDSFRRVFQFRDPLLALEAVSINSTALTLNTQVRTLPNFFPPYYEIQLTQTTDSWYLWCNSTSNGDWLRYVNITGVWGWIPQYSAGWLAVDALQAGINASVTSLTVADVDGANAYGYSPLISAGNLLQVDSEWMQVTATNTTTNVVSVIRGVNGSAAAAHSNGASVSVWQVDENIKRAVTRQSANNYAKRGAYDSSTVTDLATVTFSADFLAEVREIMQSMAYI